MGSLELVAPAKAPAVDDAPIEMRTFTMRLASGRPAVLSIPADVTDSEIVQVLSGAIQAVEALRARRMSRIHIPGHKLHRG